MSGMGYRFVKAGYNVPKPFLKLKNGQLVIDKIIKNSPQSSKTLFVINNYLSENEHFISWKKTLNFDYEIINIGNKTDGQATSLYLATKYIDNESKIYVSPCDTVVADDQINKLFDLDVDYCILTTKPNTFHLNNYSHFGWLQTDEQKKEVFCKKKPSVIEKSNVVLGFFYFKNKSTFNNAYKKVVDDELYVNNEYYIDTVVGSLVNQNLKYKEIIVENYKSYGTPEEYEQNK